MPLTDPGKGGHPEGRPLIGTLDGGVSRRLIHRCRTAASILLVIGGVFLLLVAVAPWGVISALSALAAVVIAVVSLLLLRRGALWSRVAGSSIPAGGPQFPGTAPQGPAGLGTAGSPTIPGTAASIGPPRPLSPGRAGAPVKRRLSSAVVPIHAADGPLPGGGALVVHARTDGTALTGGDSVMVWFAEHGGVASLPGTTKGVPTTSSVRGRFVLYRESDGQVFLATTRLTDTW